MKVGAPARTVLAGLLVIAAILAWLEFKDSASPPRQPLPSSTGSDALPSPQKDTSTADEMHHADAEATAANSVEIVPLLPLTTPLSEARDSWWAAARQGNGEAAWRLVEAFGICEQYGLMRKLIAGKQFSSSPEQQVLIEEYAVLAEPYCADIDEDMTAEKRKALLLGVQNGDARARMEYVLNPPILAALSIQHLEDWRQYRALAPRTAESLLADGYGEFAYHLAIAYDPESVESSWTSALSYPDLHNTHKLPMSIPERRETWLGQSLPDDPALSWRYARLCLRIVQGYERDLCSEIANRNASHLTAEQRDRLDQWVATHPALRHRPAPLRRSMSVGYSP